MAFNDLTSRDAADDPLVPDQFRSELVADLPAASVVLGKARKVPMSSKKSRQPVLSLLPDAYWVNGDTGLKQTTKVDFANSWMTAEELAVIVPIPDAYVDDAAIPIWGTVRPLIAEALGKAVDQAVLFGTGKPATWTDAALVPGAIAAQNSVAAGTSTNDLGVDIAAVGRLVAEDGYAVTGWASKPGFSWTLVAERGAQGQLIYGPSFAQGQPGSLYGMPIFDVKNGSWDSAAATLIGGDWEKCIIGMRQDITWKLFTEGVITDAAGVVVLNLMQQDTQALRVVMRLGYSLPQPATRHSNGTPRFPFGVLVPPVGP